MIPRHELVALGEDLGLSAEWKARAARATAAAERRAMLVGIRRSLLVATPAGRARLRSWLDRQRLEPSAPIPAWLLPRWLRERVVLYGDSAALGPVVTALALAPEPVRDVVLREVTFLEVGLQSCAWTGSARFLNDGERRTQIVMLGLAIDTRMVLHECGHVWHHMPEDLAGLATAQGEAHLYALAKRDGWIARAEAHVARGERIAQAIAWAWGA